MSVEIHVFLAGERMPTPQQWAETLRTHGFDGMTNESAFPQ